MLISKVFNKLKCYYYKKILEDNCGKKLPTVRVLGEIRIEGCKLNVSENVVFWPRVTFSGSGVVNIGKGSKIGEGCIIYSNIDGGGVNIGDDTIIAAQTYIIDSNHNVAAGKKIVDQGFSVAPIMIGNDVWIGANCSIIKGAQIGSHCVIGAKSLVNSVIPEYKIAFGTPAKVHGERL